MLLCDAVPTTELTNRKNSYKDLPRELIGLFMHLSLKTNTFPLHSSTQEKHWAWAEIFKGIESSSYPRRRGILKYIFVFPLYRWLVLMENSVHSLRIFS